MFRKVFMALALLAMTWTFAAQSACAEQVTVYSDRDTRTSYHVDELSITRTNGTSDESFKVKVIKYEKTYSPQEDWYFFVKEDDGTVSYAVAIGGGAKTLKRADEPANSIYRYCLNYLRTNPHARMTGN